ncbi:uncharacterized protein LOC143185135 [Calliopsis andreniformis]|uniref:uncharacterized protein LOC143185135 n=1 Tax=Calliopsis andreniformis TaxID=337506 RepID=UPI003FCEC51D
MALSSVPATRTCTVSRVSVTTNWERNVKKRQGTLLLRPPLLRAVFLFLSPPLSSPVLPLLSATSFLSRPSFPPHHTVRQPPSSPFPVKVSPTTCRVWCLIRRCDNDLSREEY